MHGTMLRFSANDRSTGQDRFNSTLPNEYNQDLIYFYINSLLENIEELMGLEEKFNMN